MTSSPFFRTGRGPPTFAGSFCLIQYDKLDLGTRISMLVQMEIEGFLRSGNKVAKIQTKKQRLERFGAIYYPGFDPHILGMKQMSLMSCFEPITCLEPTNRKSL